MGPKYAGRKDLVMYHTVYELTVNEFEELRESYFWQLQETDDADHFDSPDDIPDDVIFDHYDGISFVEEDFFCNI